MLKSEMVKMYTKYILLKMQKRAPKNIHQYPFFHEGLMMTAIGSVYSAGDGYIQLVELPSPGLLRVMKSAPGFSIANIAKKQQCQWYFSIWVNTIATGQGCRIHDKYKRRNCGSYPSFPRRYEPGFRRYITPGEDARLIAGDKALWWELRGCGWGRGELRMFSRETFK